jgi:hypothetical protein
MKNLIIKLPVFDSDSVKRLSVVPGHEKKGIKAFVATINAKALIKHEKELDSFRKINVREAKKSSLAWKKMRETLDEYPDQFFYRNKGILMLVDDFVFNNNTKTIEIVLANDELHGIADGGHTFDALKNYFLENKDEEADRVYVKVEFLVGFDTKEKVAEIVEARNTALQVQKQSIENLKNSFQSIKNILKYEVYADDVLYSEYETDEEGRKKTIKITDLISYIVVFNIDEYGINSGKVPVEAYSSKQKTLDLYIKMLNNNTTEKHLVLLPETLKLWDTIHLNMPKIIGSNFYKISKGDGNPIIKKRKIKLPYLGEEVSFTVPAGWIYPLFASFRNLIEEKKGVLTFKKDPIKFFQENMNIIAVPYSRALKEANYEPQTFAKSRLVWRGLDLEIQEIIKDKERG